MKKTAKHYRDSPSSYAKKLEYDKEYNKKPKNVKKRVELNKYNREAQAEGRAKKGDGKDIRHVDGKIVGFISASKNRASRTDSIGDRRSRGGKKK